MFDVGVGDGDDREELQEATAQPILAKESQNLATTAKTTTLQIFSRLTADLSPVLLMPPTLDVQEQQDEQQDEQQMDTSYSATQSIHTDESNIGEGAVYISPPPLEISDVNVQHVQEVNPTSEVAPEIQIQSVQIEFPVPLAILPASDHPSFPHYDHLIEQFYQDHFREEEDDVDLAVGSDNEASRSLIGVKGMTMMIYGSVCSLRRMICP